MPTYRITQNGRSFDVTAPDPRTAYESLQGKLASDATQQRSQADMAMEGMGTGERLLASVGGGMKRSLAGLGQLVLPESMEKKLGIDDATLQQEEGLRQRLMEQTTGGQLAGLAGEIAPAVPTMLAGGAVTAGMRALPAALAQAGITGAEVAAMTPGGVEERAKAGALAAPAGALGELGARGLSRYFKGPAQSEASARLASEGVVAAPWQRGQSSLGNYIAGRGRGLPLTGRAVQSAEEKAMRSFNEEVIRRATPPSIGDNFATTAGGNVGRTGREAVDTLADRFEQNYDRVYRGIPIRPDDAFDTQLDAAAYAAMEYMPSYADDFIGTVKKVRDILGGKNPTNDNIKQALRVVEDQLGAAFRIEPERADYLTALRDALYDLRNRNTPEAARKALAETNKAYTVFKQYQQAMKRANADDVLAGPQNLLSAARQLDRTKGAQFSRGKVPQQGFYQTAKDVMGSDIPKVGPGTAEKASLPWVLTNKRAAALDALMALGMRTGSNPNSAFAKTMEKIRRGGIVPTVGAYSAPEDY
jgi:hypothetical protein